MLATAATPSWTASPPARGASNHPQLGVDVPTDVMGLGGMEVPNPILMIVDNVFGVDNRDNVMNATIAYCCVVWTAALAYLIHKLYFAPTRTRKTQKNK